MKQECLFTRYSFFRDQTNGNITSEERDSLQKGNDKGEKKKLSVQRKVTFSTFFDPNKSVLFCFVLYVCLVT